MEFTVNTLMTASLLKDKLSLEDAKEIEEKLADTFGLERRDSAAYRRLLNMISVG